ncbi:hypothetical protein G3570_05580 [Balneolaceae bacterium YR4-1]|uniref:Uncharacterized protein n=1 Tax=Halalkalibaculum roseum TaxID=2709311 RepID=A0A6M1SL91_9BACT|nr:hypothetical protein [Halalkalibaculum roseum]NGP76091.1 hypothetical protein [Halalkalibaculum roseum]
MKHSKHMLPKLLAIPLLLLGLTLLPSLLQAQATSLQEMMEQARNKGVEQTQLQELQKRAQSRGLTDQQLMEIIEPAIALADENLPSETVLQKALEGLSKGVPANRMMPVLRSMQQSVQNAGPVVESWIERPNVQQMMNRPDAGMNKQQFRNEMIKATSRGFMNDIPAEEMQKLLDEIGSGELSGNTDPSNVVASVGVFAELPSTLEQPEASRSLIVRSLKGGFKTAEIQRLPAAMKMAQQRSQLPAASVIEGVARQMRDGIPAKKILQNLFNGNVGGGPPGGTPPGLENKQNRGNSGNNGNNG